MFSAIRRHLRLSPAGVVAVIALVFAMVGGAVAASEGPSSGATASAKKGAKGPRGPRGPKGPPGPAGPTGPAGPAGPTGAAGSAGKDGLSVTNAAEPKGANCPEGGSKFTVGAGAPTFACDGSPWVAGGTLPSGETVMGAWGASSKVDVVSISYAVPLTAAPTVEFHEVGYEGEPGDNCPGEASNPEAKKGFLCVYSEEVFGIEYKTGSGFPFSTPSGAVLHFEGEFGIALGTWAATAP